MIINLWDMDVEYNVTTDITAYGKSCVRISIPGNDGICLDKDQCLELSRVLAFLANEINDD